MAAKQAESLASLKKRLDDVESLLKGHVAEPHPPKPAARPRPMRETEYVVKAGDTLALIAKSLLGNSGRFTEIAALNGIRNPNVIFDGQKLRIPPK